MAEFKKSISFIIKLVLTLLAISYVLNYFSL